MKDLRSRIALFSCAVLIPHSWHNRHDRARIDSLIELLFLICKLGFQQGHRLPTQSALAVRTLLRLPEALVMINLLKSLLREEDGPTAVEYAVMLALIVAACVGAVHTMAHA